MTAIAKVQSMLLVDSMEESAIADLMLSVEHVTCVKLVPMIYHQWVVEVGAVTLLFVLYHLFVIRMPMQLKWIHNGVLQHHWRVSLPTGCRR